MGYSSWCGLCRQSTTAPSLCCPQHFGHFTAAQVALDQSMYRLLLASLFLSLPSPSPMMRRTHFIMAMLARLVRVRHRGLRWKAFLIILEELQGEPGQIDLPPSDINRVISPMGATRYSRHIFLTENNIIILVIKN